MNDNIQTVMAFDYGLRQIGVATGNLILETTQPLRVIAARDGIPNWEELESLVSEWKPDLIVVGEPLNMDGSESELSRRAGKFARRLNGRLGLPVEMADERLSSFEAKQNARAAGHKGDYKSQPIDSNAAVLILQTWFAERSSR